jgi:TM2 domain-containing membrane protein YozV
MNRTKQLQITGLLYFITGVILILFASSIIFQILMLVGGLILINEGMIKMGMGSLWNLGSKFLIRAWH